MKQNINLVNKENIEKCLEYVGGGTSDPDYEADKQIFLNMLKDTKITAKYLDTNYYFPEDKQSRNIWRISIKRNGKSISFKFGSSLQDTWDNTEVDLYDVLAGIDLDYRIADQSFEEFCADLGGNIDSIKDKKTYELCKKQSIKLQKIFTEIESYAMPR